MKLIQLNMWMGSLLDNAVSFLKKEKPDSITLQEVVVSKKLDIFSALKKELDMNGVFAKAHGIKTQDGLFYIGNAVLTRFDIINHRSVFFDFPFRVYTDKPVGKHYENVEGKLTEPKNFVEAVIETSSGKLSVVSTHLAWSEHCSERLHRIWQARKLLAELRGAAPTILAGDFNTNRDSTSYKILTSMFADLGPCIENTLNTKRHYSRQNVKNLAVDFVLGKNISGAARTVDVDISDHLPIVAEISI